MTNIENRPGRRRRLTALLTCAVTATALASCSGKHTTNAAGGGGTFSMSQQQACAAAVEKDGGTLNYWTSTDTDVFAKEAQAFNAKYPNIHVRYTSLRPFEMVQRIVAEVQAHHSLDVDAIAGDLPSLTPLFDQKLISRVDWAKLGVPQDTIFTIDGMQTVRTYRELLGLGYNTKLVKASELPATWDELVNPKWAGKVMVDPRGIYLSGLALSWGMDRAVTWLKNLLKTDTPKIVLGATASTTKVISGEAELTTSSHDNEAREQQGSGAPFAIKYLDIVPAQDWYAQILAGGAHPEAAACYFAWFTSSDGKAAQLKYEFKSNATTPTGLPPGSKVVAIDSPEKAKVATNTANAFAKLMGQ